MNFVHRIVKIELLDSLLPIYENWTPRICNLSGINVFDRLRTLRELAILTLI